MSKAATTKAALALIEKVSNELLQKPNDDMGDLLSGNPESACPDALYLPLKGNEE